MRKLILAGAALAALATPALADGRGSGHGYNPYNFNYGYSGGFRDATPIDGYGPGYRAQRGWRGPAYGYRGEYRGNGYPAYRY